VLNRHTLCKKNRFFFGSGADSLPCGLGKNLVITQSKLQAVALTFLAEIGMLFALESIH